MSITYINEQDFPIGRRDSDPTYKEIIDVVDQFDIYFAAAVRGLRKVKPYGVAQDNESEPQ